MSHIRPFCQGVLATRLVREQENVTVTFIVVTAHIIDKTRTSTSPQKTRMLSNESGRYLKLGDCAPYVYTSLT